MEKEELKNLNQMWTLQHGAFNPDSPSIKMMCVLKYEAYNFTTLEPENFDIASNKDVGVNVT